MPLSPSAFCAFYSSRRSVPVVFNEELEEMLISACDSQSTFSEFVVDVRRILQRMVALRETRRDLYPTASDMASQNSDSLMLAPSLAPVADNPMASLRFVLGERCDRFTVLKR